MQLDNIKIQDPIKKADENPKDEPYEEDILGLPAKTGSIIRNPGEKTIIKRTAKTARLADKKRTVENPDKSIVGYTAKTNSISNNPEEKTIIKRTAKTAKLAME